MHEFSLMNDLIQKIKAIAQEESAQKVVGVKVSLGALSHISADHFRDHFIAAARGTIAEDAKLEIETFRDEYDPQAQDILLESLELE